MNTDLDRLPTLQPHGNVDFAAAHVYRKDSEAAILWAVLAVLRGRAKAETEKYLSLEHVSYSISESAITWEPLVGDAHIRTKSMSRLREDAMVDRLLALPRRAAPGNRPWEALFKIDAREDLRSDLMQTEEPEEGRRTIQRTKRWSGGSGTYGGYEPNPIRARAHVRALHSGEDVLVFTPHAEQSVDPLSDALRWGLAVDPKTARYVHKNMERRFVDRQLAGEAVAFEMPSYVIEATQEPDVFLAEQRSILRRNRAAYEAMDQSLAVMHWDEYVAIVDGEICGFDADEGVLKSRVRRERGDVHLFTKRIGTPYLARQVRGLRHR